MSSYKTLKEFYELRDAEEYFDFFELEYDQHLINVKRFHILKSYGTLIKKGMQNLKKQEDRLLDFLKFSLLKVYDDFKNGYSPSAADVWSMFEDGKLKGCMGCASIKGSSCAC